MEFVEKPQDPDDRARGFTLDEATVAATGIDADPGSLLASMGIYVFRTEVLERLLLGVRGDDFGRDLIPQAVHDFAVYGFAHRGYWRDIGTIGLVPPGQPGADPPVARPQPVRRLDYPIYTRPRFLPGSKVTDCHVYESILSDGSRDRGLPVDLVDRGHPRVWCTRGRCWSGR